MHHIYSLLSCLVLFWALSSCGSATKRSPEETTKAFLSHFKEKDFEAAKKYASRDTDQTLDAIGQLAGIAQELGQSTGANLITKDMDLNTDLTYQCTEEGDKATCECCPNGTEICVPIQLIRENGQWVVHQAKETELQ